MKFAKIVLKNNYDKKGDLVLRSLIRAYDAIGVNPVLLYHGEALIIGVVDGKDNLFHEVFTGNVIEYDDFDLISIAEFKSIFMSLTLEKQELIKQVYEKMIFNMKKEDDYSSSEYEKIRNLARDREVEFRAYNNGLSFINPYEEPLNGYNDLQYKCKKLTNFRN